MTAKARASADFLRSRCHFRERLDSRYFSLQFRFHADRTFENHYRSLDVDLHPKLRPDLEILDSPQENGGRILTVRDPVIDRFYRVSAYEYALLRAMDGSKSLEEAIERLKFDGHSYSKPDAEMILSKAAQAGLLLGTKFGTHQYQSMLQNNLEKAGKEARISRLYFAYIPLVNPDAFLEKTLRIFRFLVNRWTALLALLLVPGAIYILVTKFPSAEQMYLFFFDVEKLAYLWATIVLTKLVHELAHAYTAKNFGLHVPQMGVAFLIFFPCLYCNTTDAWRLSDRRQRILTSAAGIIAEAVLALVCIYIYYVTRPGIINSLAYYTTAVSLISTVLFNANPLMKFDGYFILIDLIDRPNLFTNARMFVRYLFMNRILGISLIPNPAHSKNDALTYGLYGFSAAAYRVVLYVGIIGGVYYRFNKMFGIVLAATAFAIFVVKPLIKFTRTIHLHRKEIHLQPLKAAALLSIIVLLVGVLGVPITTRSVYPCYVESAKIQKITIPLGASVKSVAIRDRSPVDDGAIMVRLDTTQLEKSIAQKQFEREITVRKIAQDLLDDKNMSRASERRVQLAQIDHEINMLKADLETANKGIAAPFQGSITRLDKTVQEGLQTPGGSMVGELKSVQECLINVLIPEKDIEGIAWGQDAKILLTSKGNQVYSGKISSVKPFSERDLKGLPFSSRHGGEIATEAKDQAHLDAPLEAVYVASVDFPNTDGVPLMTTGRCSVSSVPRSIAGRLYRAAMQVVNRETLF
jgi:putative peptide zinc metalloprotease protein